MTSRILLAASLAMALAACTTQNTTGSNATCTRNSECRLGELCKSGACVPGCEADRDCPETLRCNPESQQCEFSLGDGGFRRDSGPIVAMDAGPRDAATNIPDAARPDSAMTIMGDAGPRLETTCNPAADDCGPGLRCLNFNPPIGPVCLPTCEPPGDGGLSQSTCEFPRRCWELSDGTGACIRTAGRDESCITYDPMTFEPMNDPLNFCEPGMLRLVDNPMAPTQCGCKVDCTLASCPGPLCECPAGEQCLGGLVTGGAGLCGTPVPPGGECSDPFGYPFEGSDYCQQKDNSLPDAVEPIAYCSLNLNTFLGQCYLVCEGMGIQKACPAGTICTYEPEPSLWGTDYRVCLPPSFPDAGMPDAAMPSSSSSSAMESSSSSAGISSSSTESSSSSADSSSTDVSSSSAEASSSSAEASSAEVSSSSSGPQSSSM